MAENKHTNATGFKMIIIFRYWFIEHIVNHIN